MKITAVNKKGFSLVEVILAVALLAAIIFSVISVLTLSQESSYAAGNTTRATFLADEGLEAIRNISEANFTSVPAGNHGLQIVAGQWQLVGTSDVVGEFTRQITVTNLSSSRKRVVVTVSWTQEPTNALRTVSLETVITDWDRMATATPTPTFTNTPTPTPSPSPSPTPTGDWNAPAQYGSVDVSGNANAVEIFKYNNHIYLGRDDNTVTAYTVNSALSLTAGSTVNTGGFPYDFKTSGNYLYIASGNDNQELQIYDITNRTNPVFAASVNLAGARDAYTVEIQGTTLFIGRDSSGQPEVYAYSIDNPVAPALLGSIQLSQDVRDISLNGTVAYVANTSNTQEFIILNIANPASMSVLSSLNLSGNNDGRTIERSGTTVTIGRVGGLVTTINAANPAAPVQQDQVDVGGSINDASFGSSGFMFVGADTNTAEFVVANVSNPSAISVPGSLNQSDDINALVWDSGYNLVYAASDSDSEEIMIIGPGGWSPPTTPTPSPTAGPTSTPTQTPSPTPGINCAVTYEVTSQWVNGFVTTVTITNNGATDINGWALTWSFTGDQVITNAWNTIWSQSGQNVTFNDAGWNSNIPASGGQQAPGFQATYSGVNGAPVNMQLNGVSCSTTVIFP
ncbi:MAG: Endoglucanase D precursor [candidate division WS6 bacterium OLB20]|uniref:Endoglucanase D n=1 Tax=candidate division WS6 bacterium OLB20 TaxID=1617426 RepID=A0A136LY99_9BACT|nr:MAG: Endoglucanase D precursor [candidate division WS6 bacterium OLB20]